MERSADQRLRTTEWEDIQYKYGNKVGKYATDEMRIIAQKVVDSNPNALLKAYNPEEEKFNDFIDRKYDNPQDIDVSNVNTADDDDDETILNFRKKRVAELQEQAKKNVFGIIKHIPGTDYISEITQASAQCWVVAIMVKLGHSDCDNLLDIMKKVAARNRDVKFVSLFAQEAIPNFPQNHLPCVLLYHNSEMVKQITSIEPWQENNSVTLASIEKVLQKHGVIYHEEYDNQDEECDEPAYSKYDLLKKH